VSEARLVAQRAAERWLRGDVIQAMAMAGDLDAERYKVRGLDENGDPATLSERAWDAVFEDGPGGYVAVRGDHPRCAAVGLYQAAGFDHAWFVITSHRIAVLRLRDALSTADAAKAELLRGDRSLGGALRGLGQFVKASAADFAQSMRRPPLAERPADAVLEWPFERPRQELYGIERWKQPLVPQFRGGPRFVQIHFTDGSWARLKTDEAGQAALTGAAD
jgi:hypothetical protein